MIPPVKIGIVGCGSVMAKPYMSLIERLRSRDLVEVVGACDIVEDKRQLVLNQFGISRFTTNYRELIEADDVDLVLVLTSMQEHGPITRAALANGKHVLVEKPMAMDLAEAAEIVALAKKGPGYLVCAPHVILSPTYQTIWRRIKRGDIGEIHLARARYGWAGPWWGKWFYRQGGGPLFDLGVYNVTSLTGLLGPAKRVMAMADIAIPERIVDGELIRVETPDNFQILIDFGHALFAVVTTGFTMQEYRSPAIELYGSTGTVQLMGDDWAPNGYELWLNEIGAWQIYEETAPTWPWTDGLRHLVDCVIHGHPPLITPEHAFHTLEIMLKVQESAQDGQAKYLNSVFEFPALPDAPEPDNLHRVHDRRS